MMDFATSVTGSRKKKPTLRFCPTAWAKLLFLRDCGKTEVGGFGISAADDLLLIEDLQLVDQRTTSVSVRFGDESVADFFETMVDQGLSPERFARIWIHTHPGDCPLPSRLDEETFRRCFGACDWSAMVIVAQDDSVYARLHFSAGPGGSIEIPSQVDYQRSFKGSDVSSWEEEYLAHVTPETFQDSPVFSLEDPETFIQHKENACLTVPNDSFARGISFRKKRSRTRRSR